MGLPRASLKGWTFSRTDYCLAYCPRSRIPKEMARHAAIENSHPTVHQLSTKFDVKGTDHCPPAILLNGPGARNSKLRGRQSDDARAITAAPARGRRAISSNAITNRRNAASHMRYSGPVMLPLENSVLPRPFVNFQSRTMEISESRASSSFSVRSFIRISSALVWYAPA